MRIQREMKRWGKKSWREIECRGVALDREREREREKDLWRFHIFLV